MSSPMRLEHPTIEVEPVPGRPGRRCLRVSYDLVVDSASPAVGGVVNEKIVVSAVDLGDAPMAANPHPIVVLEASFVAEAGRVTRCREAVVARTALDVEVDWWSSGDGGETVPIAEWADHIAAFVYLDVDGSAQSDAVTPVLTGSWGALGEG